MNCEICCWNNAIYFFDDKTYAKSKTKSYNGYNCVINPNCYNSIYVCHACLIEFVYDCNLTLYNKLIKEVEYYHAGKKIKSWWLNKLYNIDSKIGKNFIIRKINSKWNYRY